VVVVIIVVVAALAIGLVVRSRRANDTVASFRRQIDALSPEARRPVVDQVQSAADRGEPDDGTHGPDAERHAGDEHEGEPDDGDEGDAGDEGGARGS
jgi:hypothetical protein